MLKFTYVSSVKYRSFLIWKLTESDCKRHSGPCLVGSLTGEVAC